MIEHVIEIRFFFTYRIERSPSDEVLHTGDTRRITCHNHGRMVDTQPIC